MSETNPTPPVPPSGPTIPYGTPGVPYVGPEPDKDAKTMAMIAHLLGILGPIPPLILWLIKKDQMPFVNDQGKEVLNFEITLAIAWVALVIVRIVTIFVPFLVIVISCIFGLIFLGLFVANTILCIMGGMKANTGVAYRYPINFRFIK